VEPNDRAIQLLRRTSRFMRAGDLDDEAVSELTLAQLRVLFRLRNRGPITSGQLASGLGVTLPTVSSVIDRLAGQSLVERRDDPADRRRVILALTPAGIAIVERIQEGRRTRLARAIDSIDGKALAKLLVGLEALNAAAERIDAAEAVEPGETPRG